MDFFLWLFDLAPVDLPFTGMLRTMSTLFNLLCFILKGRGHTLKYVFYTALFIFRNQTCRLINCDEGGGFQPVCSEDHLYWNTLNVNEAKQCHTCC